MDLMKECWILTNRVCTKLFKEKRIFENIMYADNQWQIDMDGGGFVDLVNGSKPDGQLLDNDWRCPAEGAIFSFAYPFDVTSQITNIDGNIGLRLANGRAEQDSLKVTILTAYINVLWKV